MLQRFQVVAGGCDQPTHYAHVAFHALQPGLGSFQVSAGRGYIRLDASHLALDASDFPADLRDLLGVLVYHALRRALLGLQLGRTLGQLFFGHAELVGQGLRVGLGLSHTLTQLCNLRRARGVRLLQLLQTRTRIVNRVQGPGDKYNCEQYDDPFADIA